MEVVSSVGMQLNEDQYYNQLLHNVRHSTQVHDPSPLFTTNVDGEELWRAFLDHVPEERRKHYDCRACQHFMKKYGGLVTVNQIGEIKPVWPGHLQGGVLFTDSIYHVTKLISSARINGVFLSSDPVWGLVENVSPKSPYQDGKWHHMHIVPLPSQLYNASPVKNAEQAMAEKTQDHHVLARGLADYPIDLARKAQQLLTSDTLYRSEKAIGIINWFYTLHVNLDLAPRRFRENLIWKAVAEAPVGFCHVRSTMISTLLDDLKDGLDVAVIKRRWDEKMNPMQYQRPQAAPTEGQIAAAESTFEKLGLAASLKRRYATLDDVRANAFWLEAAPEAKDPGKGIFDDLRPSRKDTPLEIPPVTMTWRKFSASILPTAKRIEFYTESKRYPFFAFVTAVDPEAPPILQWDHPERRNPVNWYLHHLGSPPHVFGLMPYKWYVIEAITMQPSDFNKVTLPRLGQGDYLIIQSAKDSLEAGLALFPETLRSDLHGVRVVIEKFSSLGKIQQVPNPACGLALQKGGGNYNVKLRVTSPGMIGTYVIDRWD